MASAFEIEGEVSAEKALRLQTTEEKIGVSDGRLRAATVADRTGIGTRGFRSDPENAGGIEAGQRASTGADCVNVEHRNADGESGDLGVVSGLDFAFDQRNVG